MTQIKLPEIPIVMEQEIQTEISTESETHLLFPREEITKSKEGLERWKDRWYKKAGENSEKAAIIQHLESQLELLSKDFDSKEEANEELRKKIDTLNNQLIVISVENESWNNTFPVSSAEEVRGFHKKLEEELAESQRHVNSLEESLGMIRNQNEELKKMAGNNSTEIEFLKEEIKKLLGENNNTNKHARNLCNLCGAIGHRIYDCPSSSVF